MSTASGRVWRGDSSTFFFRNEANKIFKKTRRPKTSRRCRFHGRPAVSAAAGAGETSGTRRPLSSSAGSHRHFFFYLPLILWFTGLTAVLDCYYKTRARAPRNKKKERPPTRGKTPFFCYVVYFYFFPLRVPNYRQVNGGKWALAAISAAGSPSLPARFLLFRHLVLLVRVELVSVEYPDPLACVSSATARRRKKEENGILFPFFSFSFSLFNLGKKKGSRPPSGMEWLRAINPFTASPNWIVPRILTGDNWKVGVVYGCQCPDSFPTVWLKNPPLPLPQSSINIDLESLQRLLPLSVVKEFSIFGGVHIFLR